MSHNGQINALLGIGSGSSGGDDWKAKCEELQRMLASARVEQGRVAKLSAELKAAQEENAKLRSASKAEAIAKTITPEEKGDLPDEFVGLAAKVAANATDGAMAGIHEKLAKIEADREAEKSAALERLQMEFVSKINSKYPGFLDSIAIGGEKNQAWTAFLVNNSESVRHAFETCDFNALVYHVDRFYRETLGVRPPAGDRGKASIPDPATTHGSAPVVETDDPNKVYTQEEYDALEKKALAFRAAGDFKNYSLLNRELEKILSERRLK